MNIVRAFISIHDFQIHDMTNDAVFVGDAVATQHVARGTRDIKRLAAGVALHDRGDLH
jgi:hypothetical protein